MFLTVGLCVWNGRFMKSGKRVSKRKYQHGEAFGSFVGFPRTIHDIHGSASFGVMFLWCFTQAFWSCFIYAGYNTLLLLFLLTFFFYQALLSFTCCVFTSNWSITKVWAFFHYSSFVIRRDRSHLREGRNSFDFSTRSVFFPSRASVVKLVEASLEEEWTTQNVHIHDMYGTWYAHTDTHHYKHQVFTPWECNDRNVILMESWERRKE